jgi:hypothetical protein
MDQAVVLPASWSRKAATLRFSITLKNQYTNLMFGLFSKQFQSGGSYRAPTRRLKKG